MRTTLSGRAAPLGGWAWALGLTAGAGLVFAEMGLASSSDPLYLVAVAGALAGLLALIAFQGYRRVVMDWSVRVTVLWVPFANGLSEQLGVLHELVRNIDGALTLFGLGLLALHFIQERRIVLAWTPINAALGILLLSDAASIVINQVPLVVGLAGIRATMQYALLFYLIVYLNPSPTQQRRYLTLSFVTCAVICGLTLLELLRDKYILHSDVAPFATLGDRSALGLYLQFHIVMLLVLIVQKVDALAGWPRLRSALPRVTNLPLLGLLVLTLVVSNGRTAWVGIAVALTALTLATGRWRRPLVGAGIGLVLLVAFIRLSGISQYYEEHYYSLDRGFFLDRFLLLFTNRHIQDSLRGGRLYYTTLSWPVVVDHPLLGVGPGRWGGWVATSVWPSPLYAQYNVKVFYGQFDSGMLPFWAEHGTIGLACLLGMGIAVSGLGLRLRRRVADPFAGALGLTIYVTACTTLVLAFISPVFESHPWAAYLWLLAGLATVAYRQLPAPAVAPAAQAAQPQPELSPS